MFRKAFLFALVSTFVLSIQNVAPPNSNDEVFLYRAVEKVAPGHFPLNQGSYGSCVAFGHAAACDVLLAQEVVARRAAKFLKASPDSLYAGSRNEAYQKITHSRSQGSTGYGATRWLTGATGVGGVLYQQAYPQFGVDLSTYEIPRTANWGAEGNGGVKDSLNGPLDREAFKTRIKSAAKVTTLNELDASLVNGFPVTICSGQGFSSTRDKDGFCRAQGSWPHCMVIIGKRGEGRKGYLILNSWGKNWVSGPKYRDQPDGSFYAEPATVAKILRQGDSYALSGPTGFERRLLPDWMLIADASVPTTSEPYLGADGVWHIDLGDGRDAKHLNGVWQYEENGRTMKFINGRWMECSTRGCRPLATSENVRYELAA